MPLVTRSELTTTLNIGTLYPNEVLDQVIDSAENTVLSLLQRKQVRIVEGCCEVAGPPAILRFRTNVPHLFRVDDVVLVSGINAGNFGPIEGTVTEVEESNLRVAFTIIVPTFDPTVFVPAGFMTDKPSAAYYDTVPEVREAALAIAVDIFQSRVAPGGQIQAVDFTPGPYRLGRSLFTRVSGLLARWTDTSSLVG
jgi:hypothetical protein